MLDEVMDVVSFDQVLDVVHVLEVLVVADAKLAALRRARLSAYDWPEGVACLPPWSQCLP